MRPLHLFVGDGTIKIITAADRGGSAKLRFYNFDVHFLQKASYSAMNLWPVPVPTGVVDRHGHPPIVRQFQIWDTVQDFPIGNRANAII